MRLQGVSLTPDPNELRTRAAQAIASQSQPTVTVLSSLLAVEEELGYIPKEAVEAVAEHTNSTINDVWGVASFYPNFRFSPPSRTQVEVCWGTSCHIMGASRIAQAAMRALGLQAEGDTPDGEFGLRFNTCLGACAQAPVASIGHQLKGRLTPAGTEQLLRDLTRASLERTHG